MLLSADLITLIDQCVMSQRGVGLARRYRRFSVGVLDDYALRLQQTNPEPRTLFY